VRPQDQPVLVRVLELELGQVPVFCSFPRSAAELLLALELTPSWL
jgi:hypothetical protein